MIVFPPDWGIYVSAGIGPAGLPQNTGEGNDYARYAPTTLMRLTDAPAAGVALPDDAEYAMFVIRDAPISVRTSLLIGNIATAGEGFIMLADTVFMPPPGRAFLLAFNFIDTAASAAADVRVFYGRKL